MILKSISKNVCHLNNCNNLQYDLNNLAVLCNVNYMFLNIDKCKFNKIN